MMEKNNNYEIFDAMVDKFLRRQMSASEEQVFKSELSSNPELLQRAKAIALMIKSMDIVGIERDQRLVDEIKGMNKAEFRRTAGLKPKVSAISFRHKFTGYAAAACVAGLLCWAGIHYYGFYKTASLGNSFDYYAYNMDISDGEFMRGSSDAEVVERLTVLFDNVKEDTNLKEAISQLESLYTESLNENSEFSLYDNDIAWNLAIAYLKDGDRESPIPILESMIERNRNYPEITKPAETLLGQVKNL